MAKYIKGNAVANATSYELFEKTNGSYTSLSEASEINFDVDALNLASGDHVLVVKAKASGYEDSDYSNEVTYTVGTSGGNTEPETPTPTYYTITYKYVDATGNTIQANTTESVVAGTNKTFSTSNALTIDGYTISNVNPPSATVNSNITVTYTYTANEAGGEENTTYTLTINPIPADATVTLNGVVQKTITVDEGTTVTWDVTKTGYTSQNGTWLANKDETKNIALVSASTPGESYWVGEKISGKSIGSGTIKSMLNGYLAITDPTYVAELTGKTVEEIAIGLRSASVTDTAPVKIYLVDLNNPAPSAWVLKDTVTGLGGEASTVKTNVLNTPFVVPSGYTLGYYSMSVMGNGELIEGYRHSDSFYSSATVDTFTTMSIGSIDFKVKA